MANKVHRFILIAAACFIVFLLGYSIFNRQIYVPDIILGFAFLFLLYKLDVRYSLRTTTIVVCCAALLMHLSGSLGFYSVFIIGILGYDKLVHITSSIAATFLTWEIIQDTQPAKWLIVLIVATGLGAIIELNEFVGYRFLGVDRGGIFAIGDDLPEVRSELQKYDTYYDMLTNLLGSVIAVAAYSVRWNTKLAISDVKYKKVAVQE